MSLATYLSEYVHCMIVRYGEICSNNTRKYLTQELTYDWGEVGEELGEITSEFDLLDQPESLYRDKAELVWSVIHQAETAVSSASNSEKEVLYRMCDWVCCQTVIREYYNHDDSERDVVTMLSVLLMTAALERALGNVYLTKNHPVPFLLRDLLKTPELRSTFGEVPITFTQLLVGSPKGLNIRNIAWHGFISPGELHPHLISGMVVLFASLGKLLDDQTIPKRLQFSSFERFQDELSDVFPDISDRADEVMDILQTSPCIPGKCQIVWKKAYELLQTKKFGYCLVLLMPQLEHCLRMVYCKANDCPARLLTAESTAFYTTLDEILAPSPLYMVGEGLLMLLLDLTSSLTGPRLRDRLSHGEVDLSSVPPWLVNLVFCAALVTAHHPCYKQRSSEGETSCDVVLCSQLQQVTSHYHSRFHVVASLRRQLASLLSQWLCWQHCPRPPDVDVKPVSCQWISALDQQLFPLGGAVSDRLSRVKDCLDLHEPLTLYRPRTELELASALCGVAEHVGQTAEKVSLTASSRHKLWCDRALRSRARTTSIRMWTVLPDIWTALLCVVMTTTLCYSHLPNLTSQGKQIFRLVKAIKKTVENTVNLCDAEKNRWSEAHQMVSNSAASCLQWFSDNPGLLASGNKPM